MPLFKTSNPALGESTFRDIGGSRFSGAIDASARMTLSGTVNKTAILLICAIATAAWTWNNFSQTADVSTIAPQLMTDG